jgi:hypothetical protein
VFTKFWEIHPAFYQVLEIHQVLDMHQIFTKFWKFTGFSPSFGNSPGCSSSLQKILEFHQVFTKFSQGFHTFHQAFAINQEVSESHQVCTAVMVCNFESSISSAPFEVKKTQEAFCTLSRTHRTLLWDETLVDPWQTLGSQLHICGGSNLSNLREFHHYVKFKT